MAKRVLIVVPRFVPTNAADMHRVRMSLPYFATFGWDPFVLAVEPDEHEVVDPLLLRTIPASVPVTRVRALPPVVTRKLGLGDTAIRALPALYREGARIIRSNRIDLVYFSTTSFFSMPLGRLWKRRFGVPYVLDIQDPWLSDYYETHPDVAPPPKYGMARKLHSLLEPWTMEQVSGVIAVSDAYTATLRRRYSWITDRMCATIPFAASEADAALLAELPQPNPVFVRDGNIHCAYVGRAGDDMSEALNVAFESFRRASSDPAVSLARVRMHFVGTDYAADERARKTVQPLADAAGVGGQVEERTGRVPYFQALQLLNDADVLLLIGSNDPQYSASKAYPYLLARRPLVAILHERSPLVTLLTEARALVITFGDNDRESATQRLADAWPRIAAGQIAPPLLTESVLRACSSREMTRRQCAFFETALQARRQAA